MKTWKRFQLHRSSQSSYSFLLR